MTAQRNNATKQQSQSLMKSVVALLCVVVLSAPSAVASRRISSISSIRSIRSSSSGWGVARIFLPRGGDAAVSSTTEAAAVSTDAPAKAPINAPVGKHESKQNKSINNNNSSNNYTYELLQPGDGHEDDPDGIPGRYLRMQKGNRKKAKVALEETLEWRTKYEVDTILARPHPKFDICNKVLPRCLIGRDATGHVIHYLQPGLLNRTDNVSVDDLVLHCIYVLEYCWNIVEPRPDHTMTSVIDLNGLSFSKTKKLWKFIQQFAMMLSHNYPQRSYKTLVINAPGWFGTLFRMISPLLRESTRQKISLLAKGPAQEKVLREILGDDFADQVLTGEKIVASSVEQGMQTLCKTRLNEAGTEMMTA